MSERDPGLQHLAGHLAVALTRHFTACRVDRVPIPGDLVQLRDLLADVARGGQAVPSLPSSSAGVDGGGVDALAYSPRDAARALGVSDRTARRMIASGELASTKLGGRRLVPRASIDALLEVRR